MSDSLDVAYDAFIAQIDHNLESDGPSVALEAAVAAGQIDDVMTAVREMAVAAAGKAKLLWLGSPINTVLRNKNTGITATRIVSASGIPMWEFSGLGSQTFSHEPVLTPEADWKCIYDPTTDDEGE